MIAIAGNNELAKVLYHFDLLEDQDEYKIVCPFHDDVNASMKVNLTEGNFFCFGCAATGDAIEFVKNMYPKTDDLENLKLYHRMLNSRKLKGIKFRKIVKGADKRSQEVLEDSLDVAHDYYYGLKQTDWSWTEDSDELKAKLYMNKRGLTDKTLKKCRAKYSYNSSYPLIFPMLDNGSFKGWVCRTMNPIVEQKRKYLYNKGFSRRDTLVGEYSNTKVVMLVEGYMDMIKSKQNGATKVAAILGWKITQEQIAKLKAEGVTTIISALDNDECGRKGTTYLKKHFDVIRFKFPSGVKDPGDMNRTQFQAANKEAIKNYRRNEQWRDQTKADCSQTSRIKSTNRGATKSRSSILSKVSKSESASW